MPPLRVDAPQPRVCASTSGDGVAPGRQLPGGVDARQSAADDDDVGHIGQGPVGRIRHRVHRCLPEGTAFVVAVERGRRAGGHSRQGSRADPVRRPRPGGRVGLFGCHSHDREVNLGRPGGIRWSNASSEVPDQHRDRPVDRRPGPPRRPRRVEQLVRTRMDAVYRLSFAILGNEADARDAAQEAFVAAWRQLPRLRDVVCFDAWSSAWPSMRRA